MPYKKDYTLAFTMHMRTALMIKSKQYNGTQSQALLKCMIQMIQSMHCNVYNANAIQNIYIHSLGSTKLHTMGDDPTHNANVGRDMKLKGGGGGSANCSLLFVFHAIQFIHTHWVFTS